MDRNVATAPIAAGGLIAARPSAVHSALAQANGVAAAAYSQLAYFGYRVP